MWRGCLGWAYLWPALSVAGASLALPCPVSTSRSSNRAGGFPAHGSRTRRSGRRPRRQVSAGCVMASAASQPVMEFLGLRHCSGLSATSATGLELGSLPSTGITRLQKYYEPVRHPMQPGLSLAGVRLSSRDSPPGASRVASVLRVQACRRLYPGGIVGICRSWLGLFQPVARSPTTAAFPRCLVGRLPRTTFRGLNSVHMTLRPACSPHRQAACCLEGFDGFVTSTAAPIATGWSDLCRVGLTPTEVPRLFTTHRHPSSKR
jgi:hypothetical protein